MDLSQYYDAASQSPPDAPDEPSEGYPTQGDPLIGAAATTPGAYWFYQLQQEVENLITEAGLTPDHNNLGQIREAVNALVAAGGVILPRHALDYPTIGTTSNKLEIGAEAVGGTGGRVSIAAGVLIAIGEVVAAATGRMRSFTTEDWESGNLTTLSTYYLRAKVENGALLVYTQQGADDDATPGTFRGTPDALTGGGFDSTHYDVLLAKVVTSTAGTTPTVTALKNARRLYAVAEDDDITCTGANISSWMNYGWKASLTATLNWGRTPDHVSVHGSVMSKPAASTHYREWWDDLEISRYSVTAAVRADWNASISGSDVKGRIRISSTAS